MEKFETRVYAIRDKSTRKWFTGRMNQFANGAVSMNVTPDFNEAKHFFTPNAAREEMQLWRNPMAWQIMSVPVEIEIASMKKLSKD